MKAIAAAPLLLPLLIVSAAASTAASTAAEALDPRLWPEAQREFFQEGPGLLLDDAQRVSFLSLDEAGRTAFIRDFYARDPIPETPENELREGVRRRSRLVSRELLSPFDARAQLLFLQGPPRERNVIDCGAAFRPLEIWTYGQPPTDRLLVLYQPGPGDPFRLWLPIDSKQALYTKDMANWLEQWEQEGMGGKRIDRRFCPSSAEVDRATGV